ncbi:PAS domain S-box-containing protein [Natronorubrum texcoconense]|uniref:histidine kinase n=2 Tax=Natronorubrum texcoconense TaxID=1095776 RepID=A0A1G8TIL3_9EURY|nr:PAS domain S-box-containing protein [Natronorubrum texcoconense]
MNSSARLAISAVREYSVSIVGIVLLGIVGAYAFVFGGPLTLLVVELLVPGAIGVALVWYGLRSQARENGTQRVDIVTVFSVTCGAIVATFCAWSIYLLSIRAGFTGGFAQPVLSALSTGIAFGAVLGHIYVEFAHHYRENAQLSQAIDASMDGIAVVVDDNHAYANDAYAALYGVRSAAALEGTHWETLYTNAARSTIEREVLPALDERRYWRGTLTGKRADGTAFPQDVTVSALEYGSVVVARDVSEQRDREQRIQVLNRVLRHNLRNAVTVIQGHATLAGERDSTLECRHVAPILEEIDDLMTTADKARGVERTLERNGAAELVETTAVVRSVVDRARTAYPDARIITQVEEQRSEATRPCVDGSITDALDELVANAIQHNGPRDDDSSTGEGGDGPTVEIAVRTVAYETESRLEFTVTDDGNGIPDAERRAVLEGRETQLEHSSGLGLWLVAWIVQNAGGDLRFADRPGGGTIVTLSFPQEQSVSADAATRAAP